MENLNFPPEIIELAKLKKIPIEFGFELTARCNFDCKMCYVHGQNSAELMNQELSTVQWIQLFDQAYSAGMMYALLTGGECLLRQDFKELYLSLWNRVQVSVNTNASMINEEYISFFQQYRPRMIQISLYGFDDSSYYNVTRRKSFDRVKKAILELKDADIPLRLAVTVSKYNYPCCRQIFELIKELDLPYTIVSELIDSRDEVSNSSYQLSADEYVNVQKIKREVFYHKTNYQKNEVVPDYGCGAISDSDTDKPKIRCKAGIYAAFITWKGVMFPCASVQDYGIDVLSEPISEAWKKINDTALSLRMPQQCVGCPYDDVCKKCPAIRTNGFLSEKCNEEHCKLMVQCYREGLLRFKNHS